MIFLNFLIFTLKYYFKFYFFLRHEFNVVIIINKKRVFFAKNFLSILKVDLIEIMKSTRTENSYLTLEKLNIFKKNLKLFLTKPIFQSKINSCSKYKIIPLVKYKNFSNLIFRNEFKKYSEVIISNLLNNKIRWKTLKIDFLSDWIVSSMKSYVTFNGFQTRLFPFIFSSDSNILVGAPTGSGKSLLIVFSILRVIVNTIKLKVFYGKIDKKSIKVLCIAPMKALVKETVKNISNSLQYFGLTISEITGDTTVSLNKLNSSNVMIGTPEKIGIVLQSRNQKQVFENIRLIVLDEIHFLKEDRGAILENLLVYFTKNFADAKKNTRILALSATIPNFFDVAKFLNINISNGLFYFGSFVKENGLNKMIIGIKSGKSNIYEIKMLNLILLEKVGNLIDSFDKPKIIIFVQSRKDTYTTGFFLKEKLKPTKKTLSEKKQIQVKNGFLKKTPVIFKNLVENGIGIHHSGLSKFEKNFMENSFKSQLLQILISTNTLAWGVNLHATHVIIKGTKIYSAKKASWVEMTGTNIVQMIGRAGRFYSGKNDTSFIITLSKNVRRYIKLIKNQTPIESTLLASLPNFLNTEIAFQRIMNFSGAKNWFIETFLWIRVQRLLIREGKHNEGVLPRKLGIILQGFFVSQSLNELSSVGLIKIDMNNYSISSTIYGNISAFYYINYQTFLELIARLTPSKTLCELINLIACLGEFFSYYPRKNEYYELIRLSKLVSIPIRESWKTVEFKVNILIQSYIDNIRIKNNSLLTDCVYVCKNALKITRIMFEICLVKKWANMTQCCFDLYLAIKNRGWFYQKNFWTAFKGYISKKYSDHLKEKNFSFSMIQNSKNSELIQMINSKKEVVKILESFSLLPFFDLEFSIQPITRLTIKIFLSMVFLIPNLNYLNKKYTGIWVFIDDDICDTILYAKYFGLKDLVKKKDCVFSILIPIFEDPVSPYYILRIKFDTNPILNTEYVINLSDIPYPLNCPVENIVSVLNVTSISRFLMGFRSANSIKEYFFSHMIKLNSFFSENIHIGLKGGQNQVFGLFEKKEKNFLHEFSIISSFLMKKRFIIFFSNTGFESLFLKVMQFKKNSKSIIGIPIETFYQKFSEVKHVFKPNKGVFILKNLEIISILKTQNWYKNKNLFVIMDFNSTSPTLEIESSFEILLEILNTRKNLKHRFSILLTLSKMLNVIEMMLVIKLKNVFQGCPFRISNSKKSIKKGFYTKTSKHIADNELEYDQCPNFNKFRYENDSIMKNTIFLGSTLKSSLCKLKQFILISGIFFCFEYFEISKEKFIDFYITSNIFSTKSQKFLLSLGLGLYDFNFKIKKRKLTEELNLAGFYKKLWIPLSSVPKISIERMYCLFGILDNCLFIENRCKACLFIFNIFSDPCKKILNIYNQYISRKILRNSFSFPVESSWKTFFLEKGNIWLPVIKNLFFYKKSIFKKLKFFIFRINNNPRFYLSEIKILKQIKNKRLCVKLLLKLKKSRVISIQKKINFRRTMKGVIMKKHFQQEIISRFLVLKIFQKKKCHIVEKISNKINILLKLHTNLYSNSGFLGSDSKNIKGIIFEKVNNPLNKKRESLYYLIALVDVSDFYGCFSIILYYTERIRIELFENYNLILNRNKIISQLNFTVFLLQKLHKSTNFNCFGKLISFLFQKSLPCVRFLPLLRINTLFKNEIYWSIRKSTMEKKRVNLVLKQVLFRDSTNKKDQLVTLPTENNNIWWILIGDKNSDKILGRFLIKYNKNIKIKLTFGVPINLLRLKIFIINERLKGCDTESCFDFL